MKKKQISRRQFLIGSAMTAAAAALAACAPAATQAPESTATTAASQPTTAPAQPTTEVKNVVSTLPRNETLYIEGQQWNAVKGWNPYSANMNNALAVTQQDNARCLVYETPYMYNMLDGKLYPLLADGDYTWDDQRTQLTYKIKKAAHWSDGTPVTADDAAYTWATHVKYQTNAGAQFGPYIDSVEAADPQTVVVKLKADANGVTNPLMAENFISWAYISQKAWTQTLETRVGDDATKFDADPAEDFVSSGPYTKNFVDNTKVILIRDENYWGQDASMWGKLPVPKYLAHVIYKDNAAGVLADKAGEVDVSQEFIANVQDLWLKDNLPASTYMQDAPYTVCAQIPTAWFNMKSYGLDQVVIRKAIAIAVDYDTIIANAMTNQSPTFSQVPRSVMNPTDGEQAMYNHDAVKDLQWVGKDIEGAKKLLDDAGIVDTDNDGWREYNGKKLTYNACCPQGWSDWQAAMEIVAAAGKNIGIDITTNFPDWGVYQTVFTNGEQTDYDIFMWSALGATPTCPWNRVRQLFSSEYVGQKGNWNGNFGGYSNPDADKLISSILAETDATKLKDLYTQAVELYLTDVPSFSLMYRPQAFQTVFEWVWTGFPTADDGKNIPPLDLMDGYAIAGLYNLKLINA